MANKTAAVTKTKRPPGRPKESFVDNSAKAKAFGFKLKRYRAANRLTQEQMGKLMRINGDAIPSKIVIARWEAGKHAPQKRYVDRLNDLMAKNR
jgi:DNA-binding XRE family transcriptional regulator